MNKIIHLTQLISLRGQRLDKPGITEQELADLIHELDDLVYTLQNEIMGLTYAQEETIDGQHPF